MATKPLTTAAIAMTEKKMDMSLDDIIKMSKTGSGTRTNKTKKQRVPNKNHNFTNNDVEDNKSMKLHRYMDTRSSLRQGVLSQRRSSFQGNQFPLAVEAARKAPIRSRNFMRNQPMTSYRPRGASVQNRGVANQKQVKKVSNQKQKQRPQTLDSLFANMKEQRMKVLSQNNNTNTRRRTGGGVHAQQRPTPPWTRSYNY
ncbi:unnamed protein product [Lactuca virosa]|uniref:Uncharacterized protein n=1 Tax=Lactuca virosa TaxID=75947 RepID=A0AAU9PTL6_9ASTR|nr:unnamed protein product [Lactuca virosa]